MNTGWLVYLQQNCFLPSVYQGAYIDTKETEVERLIQHINNNSTSREQQRKQHDLLAPLNQRYQKQRQEDSLVEAQIQSYELAFRMQAEATDAFDVGKEPEHILPMYGETVYGRQTLIARRLLERGVRFVQIWQGKDQPWDNHEYLAKPRFPVPLSAYATTLTASQRPAASAF